MSSKNQEDQKMGNNGGYEKQDINLRKVILYGFLGIVLVVIVLVFAIDYFIATREEIVYESVLKPESAALRELRAREIEELNSYAIVDSTKGVYRIPIDRAIELMADEAFQGKMGGENR
jgi:hypothetical protein